MADNITFQTTVASPPNATIVRTKDRSGIETQLIGLDLNPGGSTEILMRSTRTDGLMPTAIDDLNISIRSLISAIANSPSRDSFDRLQMYVNGGLLAISSLPALTTITNPVYGATPGPFIPPQQYQPFGQIAWALNTRARIN